MIPPERLANAVFGGKASANSAACRRPPREPHHLAKLTRFTQKPPPGCRLCQFKGLVQAERAPSRRPQRRRAPNVKLFKASSEPTKASPTPPVAGTNAVTLRIPDEILHCKRSFGAAQNPRAFGRDRLVAGFGEGGEEGVGAGD